MEEYSSGKGNEKEAEAMVDRRMMGTLHRIEEEEEKARRAASVY